MTQRMRELLASALVGKASSVAFGSPTPSSEPQSCNFNFNPIPPPPSPPLPGQGSNDGDHHKTANRESQNSVWGCMGLVTAGNGARGHASEFPRSEESQTTHRQGPKRGRTAVRNVDADTEQERQQPAREPPTPNPGRKGGVEGRDRRWRRIGNCLRNV